MKLLVDSQLPPALARHIDACGAACIDVRDVGPAGALADNNQHASDENLRMGHYLTGMRSLLGLLTTPYPTK